MLTKDHPLNHYVGVMAVLLIVFVLFGPMINKWEDALAIRNKTPQTVTFIQPTPAPGPASAVGTVTTMAESPAVAAALNNDAVQLSLAQQTIASMAQSIGVNSKFASGGVAAITAPSPKQQVIDVGSKVTVTPAPVLPTDDTVTKAVKEAMATTTFHVQNDVNVHWEDKPVSPFFAGYSADGSSGLGYTFKRTPLLNLNALILKSDEHGTEVGIGAGTMIKGTAASIGFAGFYDVPLKRFKPGVYMGMHF